MRSRPFTRAMTSLSARPSVNCVPRPIVQCVCRISCCRLHALSRATGTNGPVAEVIVEDNGPGVPISMRAELLKRFFRGDGHGESDGGAGLGLAIVRDIVVLHGGSIHYEDGSGGGSRFVIHLPLVPN